MLRYNNKDKGENSRLVVGFSIEGGKMEKKGMTVTKSIARDVAITVKPCNKVCDAELLENESGDEDFLYKNQEFDCEILEKGNINVNTSGYRDLILSDIKKNVYSGGLSNPNYTSMKTGDKFIHDKPSSSGISGKDLYNDPKTFESPKSQDQNNTPNDGGTNPPKRPKKPVTGKDLYYDPTTWNTDNNMRKALIAGMMGGTPDSKTGSAALGKEDLEPTLKKLNKKDKLKKNENDLEERFLEHYSSQQGLKNIDPNFQGSGIDKRTRGRSLDNKISFYYPHKYENPEHQVKSNSKSKYTVKVPGDYKIFDSKVHGSDLISQAKERNNGVWNTDHFIDVLKENGYHGFKSSPSGINMVAMFHSLPAHSEEEVDHRIKKNQPQISFPKMGIENKPEMQVKRLDPNTMKQKKYQTESGKEYSQADIEAAKIQQKTINELRNQGKEIKKPTTRKGKQALEQHREKVAQGLGDGSSGKAFTNIDTAYDYSEGQDKERMKRTKGKGNFPSTKSHESLHLALGNLQKQTSEGHKNALVNHMLNTYFDKKDLSQIAEMVDAIGYKKGTDKQKASHKEEQLTHIFDMLTSPKKRDLFNSLFSHGSSGELSPKEAQQKDWDRMNRVKKGYLNLVNSMKNLDKEQLESIYQQSLKKPVKPKKEVKIQRIAPGVSGVKQ
jgi:hypothetical protein